MPEAQLNLFRNKLSSLAAWWFVAIATREAPAITVRIDPRARLVLVDGQRSDARPVPVALGDDGRAVVELVSPTGDVVRHELTRSSDGSLLRLGDERTTRERTTRPTMRRTPMQAAAVSEGEGSPLLGDPY